MEDELIILDVVELREPSFRERDGLGNKTRRLRSRPLAPSLRRIAMTVYALYTVLRFRLVK